MSVRGETGPLKTDAGRQRIALVHQVTADDPGYSKRAGDSSNPTGEIVSAEAYVWPTERCLRVGWVTRGQSAGTDVWPYMSSNKIQERTG